MRLAATVVAEAATARAVAVPITTALIQRINRREAEIRQAGRTMLRLACEQGKDLNQLKADTPHGEFAVRIQRETVVSYVRCRVYMQLQREVKLIDLDHFDSIEDAIRSVRKTRTSPGAVSLTRTDAEYILKIHALCERGATDGERDAAESKLDGLAKQYGTDAATLVKKAEKLCPDQQQSAHAVALREEVMAPYVVMSKAQLLDAIYALPQELAQHV